jgi:hypothetical protein
MDVDDLIICDVRQIRAPMSEVGNTGRHGRGWLRLGDGEWLSRISIIL